MGVEACLVFGDEKWRELLVSLGHLIILLLRSSLSAFLTHLLIQFEPRHCSEQNGVRTDTQSIFKFFINFCYFWMSQKTEKPVLSGQRIKTRKRGKKISTVFLLCLIFCENNGGYEKSEFEFIYKFCFLWGDDKKVDMTLRDIKTCCTGGKEGFLFCIVSFWMITHQQQQMMSSWIIVWWLLLVWMIESSSSPGMILAL